MLIRELDSCNNSNKRWLRDSERCRRKQKKHLYLQVDVWWRSASCSDSSRTCGRRCPRSLRLLEIAHSRGSMKGFSATLSIPSWPYFLLECGEAPPPSQQFCSLLSLLWLPLSRAGSRLVLQPHPKLSSLKNKLVSRGIRNPASEV